MDLSTNNIIITRDLLIKIIDFGEAYHSQECDNNPSIIFIMQIICRVILCRFARLRILIKLKSLHRNQIFFHSVWSFSISSSIVFPFNLPLKYCKALSIEHIRLICSSPHNNANNMVKCQLFCCYCN